MIQVQRASYLSGRKVMVAMNPKRVLFLYTELAAYVLACFNEAAAAGLEVLVVRWPVNQEAPFEFEFNNGIRVVNRSDYDHDGLLELSRSFRPDIILSSGWVDKGYMAVCKAHRKTIPVVLLLDNQWSGAPRQRAASIAGRLYLHRFFSHCWVPGERQKQYALKLAFAEQRIKKGFYCADMSTFNEFYRDTFEARRKDFPKRFLFVGRYLSFKGTKELWEAFVRFRSHSGSDWELWCVGAGEGFDQRVQAEGIRHFGFLQPAELKEVIAQCGVFVLPSHKEPWGVVVQEFAAAGFPLICSKAVGAADLFLEEGINGYLHEPADAADLEAVFSKIAGKSDQELSAMADASHRKAQLITPETWVKTLKEFIPD